MYSAQTLRNLNNKAVLRAYVEKHPLIRLHGADSVKHAPDYAQVDIGMLEKVTDMKEVDTYFVDSSGFGASDERALTYTSFREKVQELIDQGKKLYACCSGIGQFQVYVTILEKV